MLAGAVHVTVTLDPVSAASTLSGVETECSTRSGAAAVVSAVAPLAVWASTWTE